METVIAKPRKTFMAGYIVLIVMGVIFSAIGIFSLVASEYFLGGLMLVLGVFIAACGIGWTAFFAHLPKAYITFKEGKFRFWNGLECSPSEIDYCNASCGLMDGGIYNCGRIMISVGGTAYKLRFVDNVNNAAAQISALKAQFTAIEEMQKHIAEKKAAETPQNEEKIAENIAENAQNEENKG